MRPLLLAFLLALAAAPALADRPFPPVANETYKSECGACHMAFQPQMLPRRSWARLMAGLADHFGEDASLEPTVRGEIARYLDANAGDVSGSRAGRKFLRGLPPDAAPLRITELPRWRREHRPHEVPPSAWRRPEVGSKANCAACHGYAARGYYDDD